MTTTPSCFNLNKATAAEAFINQVQYMVEILPEYITDRRGLKIAQMKGVEFTKFNGNGEPEYNAGKLKVTADCDVSIYQFPDGSLLWYFNAPDNVFVQLRGMYNGVYRNTEYLAARDKIKERNRNYPDCYDDSLQELDLRFRTWCTLRDANINYIGDLIQKTEKDLLKIKGLGRTSLSDIIENLSHVGLKLNTDVTGWVNPQAR